MNAADRVLAGTLARSAALRFVIAFGIVSLFADMTYEGMRSIAGPYLAVLGASGAAVGLIGGFGDGVRLATGLRERGRPEPALLADYGNRVHHTNGRRSCTCVGGKLAGGRGAHHYRAGR